MRILLSALACEPGRGSENEVGFRAMMAAASRHEVWVLTNTPTIPSIAQGIPPDMLGSRIHLEGIDFPVGGERFDRLTAIGFQWNYDKWQRAVAARARQLDRKLDFDVVHHVTLASYWTRAGVAALDKPLVWGPVGGGVQPPLELVPELGLRGAFEAAGRVLVRPAVARVPPFDKAQRSARVTFAQNQATANRIRTKARLTVMSNALAVELTDPLGSGSRNSDILFVGRLLAWKAPMLAVRALRYVNHPRARLRFCGKGSERRRLERQARRWGLSDRVSFEGWMPRQSLLSELATAGALIHPAMHEEAGLCLAEALTLRTPVVCLDYGGPPEVARHWPDSPQALVPVGNPEVTARQLAAAIDRFLTYPPPVAGSLARPTTSFGDQLLRAYEEAVPPPRPSVRGLLDEVDATGDEHHPCSSEKQQRRIG